MIAKGKMNIIGEAVHFQIDFENRDWFITIRRTDMKGDKRFDALNNQEVGPAQIAEFVPNRQNLEWQHVSLEGISQEAYIQDGDYKLSLICLKESPVDPKEAIQEFTEFMTNKLKQMQEKVKDELEHIPDWPDPEPQNKLRMIYWTRRMHSLSEKVVPKQTAKEVLERCISNLKKDYPNFQFKYDEDFFNKCG